MIILERDNSPNATPSQQVDSLMQSAQMALGSLESEMSESIARFEQQIERAAKDLKNHTHEKFDNPVAFEQGLSVKGDLTLDVDQTFLDQWSSVFGVGGGSTPT